MKTLFASLVLSILTTAAFCQQNKGTVPTVVMKPNAVHPHPAHPVNNTQTPADKSTKETKPAAATTPAKETK